MMYLKIVPENYDTPDDVENLIKYILRDKSFNAGYHTNTYIGGLAIYNIYNAANEFSYVRYYYGKTSGRLARHIILSPDPRDLFIGDMMYLLGLYVSAYYAGKYQIIFGVHTDEKKHPHIHFVLNTVSWTDGRKLHDSLAEQAQFRKYCEECYTIIKSRYSWVKQQLKNF